MIIDIEKLTVVLGCPYDYKNPDDPITKMIEEKKGRIIKVFVMNDLSYITLCHIYEKDEQK